MASLNIQRADFHGEWHYTTLHKTNYKKQLFPDGLSVPVNVNAPHLGLRTLENVVEATE